MGESPGVVTFATKTGPRRIGNSSGCGWSVKPRNRQNTLGHAVMCVLISAGEKMKQIKKLVGTDIDQTKAFDRTEENRAEDYDCLRRAPGDRTKIKLLQLREKKTWDGEVDFEFKSNIPKNSHFGTPVTSQRKQRQFKL